MIRAKAVRRFPAWAKVLLIVVGCVVIVGCVIGVAVFFSLRCKYIISLCVQRILLEASPFPNDECLLLDWQKGKGLGQSEEGSSISVF